MNRKKGFTLIELLAVIALLSILFILAIPGVLELYNNAKDSTFIDQARSIFNTAEKQYLSEQISELNSNSEYCHGVNSDGKTLELNGNSSVYYDVKLDESGKVIKLVVSDGAMSYEFNSNDNKKFIDAVDIVNNSNENKGIYVKKGNNVASITCTQD